MNTLRNKKVSVIVPNYNYGQFIGGRIKSIIKQTYPIFELIILDDASTDGSDKKIKKILGKIKKNYPGLRVKYIKNEQNTGKAILQWKKGIEMAEGDYIWIAEADDLCNKNFLEKAMEGFNNSEVVLSYTESRLINGCGLMIAPNFRWSRDREKSGHFKKSYTKDGKQEIEEIMAIRCTIPNVSAVVFKKDRLKKSVLDKAAEFTQVGDWYLYLKVLEEGKISYNKKSLNYFRVHRESVTNKARGGRKHLEEIKYIQEMVRDKYRLGSDVIKNQESEYKRVKDRVENY